MFLRKSVLFISKRYHVRCLSVLPEGATLLPLPALSPTMESGSIANWLVDENAAFEAGSVMCEVETDKATVDYESVDDGVMAKILVAAGAKDVKVGTPIAVVAEDEEIAAKVQLLDVESILAGAGGSTGGSNNNVNKGSENAVASSSPSPVSSSTRQIVAPAAAFLLKSYGVDVSSVQGSGRLPSGVGPVVTKTDALKAIEGKSLVVSVASAPVAAASPVAAVAAASPAAEEEGRSFEDEDLTSMRKVIASRLTEAKQSRPHFYAEIDCELDQVLSRRSQLKQVMEKAPSINDMIVRAVGLALRDVPRVNCRMENGKVIENESVDVAIAVATPTGLITPIVKNTDGKDVLQISSEIRDLAGRARKNKLKLDEFQGGSFAVSNLGMFGISSFTAVISPPHSAILAVGGSRQELTEDGWKEVMTVQLSCDRRVIDDATAGRFLQVFRNYLQLNL